MLKKVSMAAMVHDAMERTWNSPGIRRMVPGRLIPGKMVKIKWFHRHLTWLWDLLCPEQVETQRQLAVPGDQSTG
jgi:hypothetical protein